MNTKASIDLFFTREGLEHTGAMYLAGQDSHLAHAQPRHPRRPDRLPSLMLLQAGTNEILPDDSTRMASWPKPTR